MRPKHPLCVNPDHPGSNRNTMEAVETDEHFIFWCKTCADVLKRKVIQVRTKQAVKDEVRHRLMQSGRMMNRIPQKLRKIRYTREED